MRVVRGGGFFVSRPDIGTGTKLTSPVALRPQPPNSRYCDIARRSVYADTRSTRESSWQTAED